MAKRRKDCARLHCYEPPFLAGLCKRHHEEDEKKLIRYDAGLKALNTGRVDDEPIRPGPLCDEFHRLLDWWHQVCNEVNYPSGRHPILRNEAVCARDWCISLAECIVDDERELRAGKHVDDPSHHYIRKPLWERFENLKRGLMSNGVPRPAARP